MSAEPVRSVRLRISAPKVAGLLVAGIGLGVALACGLLGWCEPDYDGARRWFSGATVALTCGGLGMVTFVGEWLSEVPAGNAGQEW